MTHLGLGRYTVGIAAALAMFAGCGGTQPPIGAPGGPSSALAHKEQSLLYISDEQASDVYMVALPSGKLVGKLTGFNYASGDCTDEHGNVFVGNLTEGQVRGYAHGAKSAFRVLNDPSWWPESCSVDPTTGNLAVCNIRTNQSLGSIAVYRNAKGTAHYYQYSNVINFWYCAYDSDGDLFADAINYGSGGGDSPILFELPNGSKTMRPVSLSPAFTGDASPPLFWDGKYLAVATPDAGFIYQYKISGNTGTRVNVVKLDGASKVLGPFWIASDGSGQTLYAPVAKGSVESVGVYGYPSGGKRLQNLYDAPLPFAAAVSAPNNAASSKEKDR
jgi:hypothetical protein